MESAHGGIISDFVCFEATCAKVPRHFIYTASIINRFAETRLSLS